MAFQCQSSRKFLSYTVQSKVRLCPCESGGALVSHWCCVTGLLLPVMRWLEAAHGHQARCYQHIKGKRKKTNQRGARNPKHG